METISQKNALKAKLLIGEAHTLLEQAFALLVPEETLKPKSPALPEKP